MTITADASDLEDAEQVALKKLAKDVKVNGFRKGHAPIELVRKNVDLNLIGQETLENAVSKTVAEAVLSENLQVLERPNVEVKKFVPGEMLEYTAEADVLPEVTLGDYKKLKSDSKPVATTKADVDEIVDRMRQSFAEKKETKEAAKNGDEVVIDFVGKMNGEAFDGGSSQGYPLVLGSGTFIPGFEDGLIGVKSGDKRDVPVKFPSDYQAKNLAGQDAIFEVTVGKVNQVVLPEVDDVFAAKVGPFTDVKQMRDDIKREINAQHEREANDKRKDDLVEQLVGKSKLAVPKVLVEDNIQSIEQDLLQNLAYRGQKIDNYYESQNFKDRDDWVKKEATPIAEKRVKAGLVLAELSRQLKIEATAEEVEEFVANYKQQYANSPSMSTRFDDPNVRQELINRLITEKTVDELVKINS